MPEQLERILVGRAGQVRFDEPLAGHTTFRIGGPADVWAIVETAAGLAEVVSEATSAGIPVTVLGCGSNVLISNQGLRGIVLRLAGELARIDIPGRTAGAGALLDEIADAAEEQGLAGVEFLAGIPGTVGGGLRSNAGAYGRCLYDAIDRVRAINRSGRPVTLERDELRNEYRSPIVPQELVVTGAELRLEPGRPAPARELRKQRWGKHPKEPSAGSFFRNPASEPAGRLIDRCGLKGRRVGGARVSELHGNFIVNDGGARFADVLELAETVKANVEEQTGIELAEEVQVLPESGGPLPVGLDRRQAHG
jgi:UDP-N-acetylmuramate dehydrogenase